jgi:ABC-type lipoprotein export system ATPase subunit
MRELNERNGLTFVLVTHDASVGDLCDRIVRMRDGLIVGETVPSTNRQPERIVASGANRPMAAAV